MLDAKGFAFLACRILALYALYWAARNLVGMLPGFVYYQSRGNYIFDTIYPSLFTGIQFAGFLALWFGASWMSPKMVPKEAPEVTSGTWDMAQLTSLIVSIFGLILVVNAVPRIGNLIVSYSFSEFHNVSEIRNTIIRSTELTANVVMGLVLIFGSKKISEMIKWARNWQFGKRQV